jgi:hypothetical protein
MIMFICRYIRKIFFFAGILILIYTIIYGDEAKKKNTGLIFGKEFYSSLNTVVSFQRDVYFDSLTKKSINARGFLLAVERTAGNKKKFRAVFSDEESLKYGFKVLYYLYSSDRDLLDLLKKGELYSFKGKILGWTPLDSKRKEFIFDIMLEAISRENK